MRSIWEVRAKAAPTLPSPHVTSTTPLLHHNTSIPRAIFTPSHLHPTSSPQDTHHFPSHVTFLKPPPPHTRKHARMHTRTHTRTHARTHARTHTSQIVRPSKSEDCYSTNLSTLSWLLKPQQVHFIFLSTGEAIGSKKL